jgi:hypothetical protein
MPAGMAVLLVVLLVVFGLVALIVAIIRDSPAGEPGRDRKTRAYISELEDTVENIRSIAYDNKDVEPGLADIIIDELKQHRTRVKTKELE